MSDQPQPPPAVPHPQSTRVGKIVRWSARVASLPTLALISVSLVPTLAHFSVAASDERKLAYCLCGAVAGLLAGWRWPGIGGFLVVVSVGLIAAQNDGGLFADPFTIAFGLQGLLFLLSWGLNQPRGTGDPGVGLGWGRKAAVGLLALAALGGVGLLLRGPEAESLPKGKELLAGTWESAAGLKLEISIEGKATLTCPKDSKVDPWNLPASGPGTNDYKLFLRGGDTLELTAAGTFGESKNYHVDRWPRFMAKQTRMVLNGSDPYKPDGGIVLVRQAPPASTTATTNSNPKSPAQVSSPPKKEPKTR